MELIHAGADAYASSHTTELDELLAEILRYTEEHHPQSHMISGKLQGQFLRILSKALQPKRILEVGTFTGFSALCMAQGLTSEGVLHTIELRENDARVAQNYFNQSSFAAQIQLHTGDALQVIPLLKESWDLVFIDADKVNYSNYYDLILPSLAKNGILLADNVLFHGQVLENPVTGKNAIAMDAFNKKIKADDRVEQVVLTIRDGLTMLRKK